jgi:hypothetical protein
MKKFNGFESYLIEEALADLMQKKEAEVLEYRDKDKRCIFAEGYFTMVIEELIDKVVNDMTRKQKT